MKKLTHNEIITLLVLKKDSGGINIRTVDNRNIYLSKWLDKKIPEGPISLSLSELDHFNITMGKGTLCPKCIRKNQSSIICAHRILENEDIKNYVEQLKLCRTSKKLSKSLNRLLKKQA